MIVKKKKHRLCKNIIFHINNLREKITLFENEEY